MSGESSAAASLVDGSQSRYVKLNVGGMLFYTTLDVLTKHDTMLQSMFSGRMKVRTDSEGWILIDRNGQHFGLILNFLRDGHVPLPENDKEVKEILQEARFYCIQGLIEVCDRSLSGFGDAKPSCLIPYITSPVEEQAVLGSTNKPVVRFLCNRHNNNYSYTSNSDDNFLRNIELFDKLSLRFHKRIQFMKDMSQGREVCCWSFYGNRQKVAEISCTSIVYGTDKKHTKVDFPEARIYEETLNLILYENPLQAPPPLTTVEKKQKHLLQDKERL